MKTLLRLVATVLVAALGVAAIGAAVVPQVVQIALAHDQEAVALPPLAQLAQRSIVYDAGGNTIAIFKAENREPFTLDKVPQPVRDAVLAVEDDTFYEHKGVNAKSLVRAVLANVSAGEVTQGGSTITQQLVKNSLLTSERDANRKILEASYAIRLERQLTKDQILERYLNTVYLGNNAYGLQAAAETYFGKNVDQLDIYQGAFLAGMIRNPVGYNPIENPMRSRARFRQALDRLVSTGKLTQAQADDAGKNWALPSNLQRTAQTDVSPSYFSEEVRKLLLNGSTTLGADTQERYNRLYRGGLRIFTTLDPRMQQAAEQAVATEMPDTGGRFQASLAAVDSKSGAIRAMVGGRGFDQSQVNLAVTPRQTGSSAKFFVLAAALTAGVQYNDTIDGGGGGSTKCTIPNPNNPKEPLVISDAATAPRGPIDRMTWLSINCAYSELAQIVGLNRVVDMAHRLGVQSPIQPNASFAVGSEEISSLDFADSAATVADLGVRHESYYIERIEDPNGNVIYQHQDPGTQVLDQGVALRMIDVLKGVVTKGTVALDNSKPLADGRISAGKTGTYTDNTNATFVGFTTQLAAAVWMGNPLKSGEDQMRNIPEFNQIGVSRVQGGNLPYRIWKAFMDGASQGMPNEDWPAPPPPKRKAQNVYLPGYECLARVGSVSGDPSGTNPDGSPSFDQSTYNQVKSGTTIPPTNLDPTAPVGAYAPGGVSIYKCGTAPVNTAPRPAKTTTPTTAAGAAPPSASTPAAPTKPSSPPASAAIAATPPNAEKP